jgi:ATP-binding protein involved in chromosome partitioning
MQNMNKEKQKENPYEKIKENLKKVKNKVMVMSGKGGVGKSTVAANLALVLAGQGQKVGLLDIDIHGPNLPKMLGVEEERLTSPNENRIEPVKISENLKLVSIAFMLQEENQAVIWRGPLKMKLIQQFLSDIEWNELDWLIIDAPPGTGDEPLSMAQLVPEAKAIIVTTPQELSLLDVKKSIDFAEKINLKILGIVENMSGLKCPHCGKDIMLFKGGGGKELANKSGINFLGSIPIDPEIVAASDTGIIYAEKFPDSEATKALKKIAEGISTNDLNHKAYKET